MTLEKITLIFNIINSTLLALLFIYLKLRVEKRLTKYEASINEISDLNKKLHDRLVEAEDYIERNLPLPKELVKRLKYVASRFQKYDPTITSTIKHIIYAWNRPDLFPNSSLHMFQTMLNPRTKDTSLQLIEDLKVTADNLVKE